MLRNYFAAALRNLLRNKLIAAINIVGLAVGLAAALLIALYIRYERSFETFIPGFEGVYRVNLVIERSGKEPEIWDTADYWTAEHLATDFPEIEAAARLVDQWYSVRRGDVEHHELTYTADPAFFKVVPVKAVAGDLATALDSPESIVITRRIGRKYFGDEDPLGETLHIQRFFPARITAVIEDLPGNTHFNFAFVTSARAPFSSIRATEQMRDQQPVFQGSDKPVFLGAHTYFRLRPGAMPERIVAGLADFQKRHYRTAPGESLRFVVRPLRDLHLSRPGKFPMTPAGNPRTLDTLALVATLVVLLAVINFVNLTTARAMQRSVEVGVRKAAGARRRDLIVQFIGEAGLYVFVAMLAAMAAVELVLPRFNAMLDTGEEIHPAAAVSFEYWSDPGLALTLLLATLSMSVLAGAYPAFVMSGLRPVTALQRGGSSGGTARVRQVLVVVQLAILIALIFATAVIHRQTTYAMNDALRIDRDQILLMHLQESATDSFKNSLAAIPGVRGVTGSLAIPTNFDVSAAPFVGLSRLPVTLQIERVDFNFFEFYGLKPLAGRLHSRAHGTDVVPAGEYREHWSVLINESAVRILGFASPAEAVGGALTLPQHWMFARPPASITIAGVVPDFPSDSVRLPIQSSIYVVDPTQLRVLSIRLSGDRIPEALAGIDKVWGEQGEPHAISRWFLEQYYHRMYIDVIKQRRVLGALSCVAVFLGCLGLFGLSIFTAQRRTKEIGVRKVMGASTGQIMVLLLWAFTRPVLWASLVAWPIAAWVMRRWLDDFVYRVDLGWWLLPVASLAALGIALATVSAHSYAVARANPARALRYE